MLHGTCDIDGMCSSSTHTWGINILFDILVSCRTRQLLRSSTGLSQRKVP
jgi:hypothetical protein